MLEQMYSDFVNKLLPQIQTGLAITKDYFLDLFGRYVKYLIVSDSVKIFFGALILIGSVWGIKKTYLWLKKEHEKDEDYEKLYDLLLLFIIPIVAGCFLFFCGLSDLIKDIYIPEVRIIEILSNFKK